jgi:hypothetical protein
MSRQLWVVLYDDGSVACQPIIVGDATPSQAGDNPDGLREFRVSRHGDLQHERFDTDRRRWVSDGARKRKAARRAQLRELERDDLVDHIVEEVMARLKAAGLPV